MGYKLPGQADVFGPKATPQVALSEDTSVHVNMTISRNSLSGQCTPHPTPMASFLQLGLG